MKTKIDFIVFLVKKILRGIIPGSVVVVYQKTNGKTRFLILKAISSKKVVLPGGSISWWESYEEAAKRELCEETNINASSLRKLPLVHTFRFNNLPFKPKGERPVFLYQLSEKKKIKLYSKEAQWFKWVSAQVAMRQLRQIGLSDTFRKALGYID